MQNLHSTESGAVADIFDSNGNMLLKPVHVAEKFHPRDVMFRLDVGTPLLKERMSEMAKLGHMGFENFCILLSGVRDMNDLYKARVAAGEAGLNLGSHTRFGLSVDYPSLAMLHEEVQKKGPSLIMMDLDALGSKLHGGLNTGQPREHDGIHPAVLKVVEGMGESSRRHGVLFGVSGKAVMSRDAVAELVHQGVDFFVTPHEHANALKEMALHAEKKRELEFLKDKIKMHMASRRH